jgi:glycosyltransferase involved in cell wall biosynthesis
MNILYFGRYSKNEILAGPLKVANRIFNIMNEKYSCEFIEYFFDGKEYGLFKKLFGKEIIIYDNKIIFRLGLFRIFFHMFKFKPQLIHILTYERFAVITFIFRLFSKMKIIYNVHNVVRYENENVFNVKGFEKIKDNICETVFIKYSDVLFFLSESNALFAGQYYNFSSNKNRIISNGVDEVFYTASVIRETNKNNPLSLIFIGDIERKDKGFEFLKNILEKISIRINLYIISKRTYYKLSFINKSIQIQFLNLMSPGKLSAFLRDKDIFISTSSNDSFNISSVEAMAAGAIPILTKETGSSRFIKQGVNGFVFGYGDTDSFVNAINLLNGDRIILQNMMKECPKIYDELSWKNISDLYESNYKNILADK